MKNIIHNTWQKTWITTEQYIGIYCIVCIGYELHIFFGGGKFPVVGQVVPRFQYSGNWLLLSRRGKGNHRFKNGDCDRIWIKFVPKTKMRRRCRVMVIRTGWVMFIHAHPLNNLYFFWYALRSSLTAFELEKHYHHGIHLHKYQP